GRAARLQRRHAGDAVERGRRPRAGLYRRGAPVVRRHRADAGADRTQGIHGSSAATEGCMSMGLLRLLRGNKASAPVARERLQILLAHERGMRGQPDLLSVLREEILAVVSKHVTLDPTKVIVRLERGDEVSTLEVDIEVPNDIERKRVAVG